MEAGGSIAATRAGGGDPSRSLVAARPRRGERLIQFALAACAVISVITTTAIVISLLSPTLDFFSEVSPGDFFSFDDWAPLQADASFGVFNIVIGTLSATLWGLVVAIPIGLLSAIYLSEYAKPGVRRIVKPTLEVLAGVPTVAFGVFAVTFLSPEIGDLFPGFIKTPPFAAGIAGIAIGLLIVPIIASISDDAMRSVPGGLREGAYGLGATKLKVSTRVVLPAAISGIIASIVLATSRAIGETMVVLLAAGKTPNATFDPGASVLTMTAFIGTTATGDVSTGSDRLRHDLRRRRPPVRHDPGDEHHRDPARPSIPGGLRVRPGLPGWRNGPGWQPRGARRRSWVARVVSRAATSGRGNIFFALLLLAVGLALLGLVAVIVQSAVKGAPAFGSHLFTEGPSTMNPENAGFRPAIIGSIYLITGVIVLIVPLGVGAALYLEEYADNTRWWNRLIELNIQNLAAVPSIIYGILGLAFFVRGPFDLGFVVARRIAHARPARAADGDHRRARGDPRGAALDSRGIAGARRDPVADDPSPGIAGFDPRDRDRCDPRGLAGARGGGAAPAGGGRRRSSPSTRSPSLAGTPRCRCRSSTTRCGPRTSSRSSRRPG